MSILCSKKAASLFASVQTQVKMSFFLLSVHPYSDGEVHLILQFSQKWKSAPYVMRYA